MELYRTLRDNLRRANLTEEEIVFYEQIIKKPGASAFEISKRAGFPKDRGYALVESLFAKQLVETKTTRRGRGIFPSSLKKFAEGLYSQSRRYHRVGEALENINSALPFLREDGAPSSIQAFTLDEFPEHWADLSYTSFEHVVSYGNFEGLLAQFGIGADKQFIDRRVKRGKTAEVVLTPTPYADEMVRSDSRHIRNTRILDVPQLQNILAIIFPDLQSVSLWNRNKNGGVSGLFIKHPLLTDFHEELYAYFKKEAENPSK